jgi:hypothetical protein
MCWTWRPVFKIKTHRLADALPGLAAAEHAAEGAALDLEDVRPPASRWWSHNRYRCPDHDSYYGTISMKVPNALKVEACALGRFFCSGNVWSRADIKPVSRMSDRGNWLSSRS